jgi:hypothetical protein
MTSQAISHARTLAAHTHTHARTSQQKWEPQVWQRIWLQPPAFSTGLWQLGQGLAMALISAWFLRFSAFGGCGYVWLTRGEFTW